MDVPTFDPLGLHFLSLLSAIVHKFQNAITVMGHAVVLLVEARKVAGLIPNGVIGILHLHTTSGRNMVLCVRLTTLPPSCVDYLEIWEPQPPGTLRKCKGIALSLPITLFAVFYYILKRHYESKAILSMLRL